MKRTILSYLLFSLLTAMTIGYAQAQTVPRNAAQLSWTNAATNTDGTAIPASCDAGVTQCAKITSTRVEYGTCNAGAFGVKAGVITVAAPATVALVSNLVVQTYCFRSISVNDYSVESAPSNVQSKTIVPPTPGAPLLAISSTAYEIRANANGTRVASRIGVIPMGTSCSGDEQVRIGAETYSRVSRASLDVVNWPQGDPLVEVWGKCG